MKRAFLVFISLMIASSTFAGAVYERYYVTPIANGKWQSANVVMDATVNSTLRISGNVNMPLGRLNIGNSTETIVLDGVTKSNLLQLNDIGGNYASDLVIHEHSTTGFPEINLLLANSNTAAHATVTAGQVLGDIRFAGNSGAGNKYQTAARIEVVADPLGTITSVNVPGRINFYTDKNGQSNDVTGNVAMQIDYTQTVSMNKLNVGGGSLFVSSNGNVGIGTTAPSTKLEVAGTVSVNKISVSAQDYCFLATNSSPAIGGGLWVTWNIETSDTNGMHTASSVSVDILSTGIYSIVGNMEFHSTTAGSCQQTLFVNGVDVQENLQPIGASTYISFAMPSIRRLNVGDKVAILVNAPADCVLYGSNQAFFQIVKLF